MPARIWTLLAVSLATFMTYLDNNIVNVAIPAIQRDLHLSTSGLEWVVSGYILVFASLLLAALWGTSRATPIAGAGHQASRPREVAVTTLLASGSLASVIAVALVLWGLCAWKP